MSSKDYFYHETSVIDQPCQIGKETKIWHFSHIMENANIGQNCHIGQNVFIASGVQIGSNVKIQNNVSLYEGTIIEDDVFLGPSCVLTNISNPRSQIVRKNIYEKTKICKGVTIGANATIICGISIGRYAFISAGAVVTKNIPDYALMVGVPAKQVGWMSRHGHRLKETNNTEMVCPESQYHYAIQSDGNLKCLDLDEDSPLPSDHKIGKKS